MRLLIPIIGLIVIALTVASSVERFNSNAVRCVWCDEKIVYEEPVNFTEYFLHKRCFSMLVMCTKEQFGDMHDAERYQIMHNMIRERLAKEFL